MPFLKKIFNVLGKNTESNSSKDYQADSKPLNSTTEYQPFTTAQHDQLVGIEDNVSQKKKVTLLRNAKFWVIVAGVSFYQETLEKICCGRREEEKPLFTQGKVIPDDGNSSDAYAVRVEINHELVGHLSRTNARIWRSKMISDNHSGVVTCPAKIVWDRGAFTEGSYGVWLDLNLSLSDSKPEMNIGANTPVSDSPLADHIKFLVNKLNRFELSHCKEGDDVNLWVAEGTREIFIYRQGTDFGEGKIGVCPDQLFETICNAPGCDAKIVSIYEGGCKIDCRLISKAEMTERIKRVKEEKRAKQATQEAKLVENLRVDFDRKYSPKAVIKATFHLIYHSKLAVGDRVCLGIKSKKFYLRYPRQLRVDLLNQAKEKIGEIRNKEPVLRIIKASYNGYDFDLEVEALYGLYTQYDVEYDPSVGETARYATIAILPKKEGHPPLIVRSGKATDKRQIEE